VANREGWEVIPEGGNGKEKMEVVPQQPADPDSHLKHVKDFIDAVRARKSPVCEIEHGHDVALVAHMGNIAYKTGSKLHWDAGKGQFKDDKKANDLLKPEYRSPWKFPSV